VNKVLERARTEKVIGSSLEAKVLLYVADDDLRQRLQTLNPSDRGKSNGVDELRYLLLTSQVEVLTTIDPLAASTYSSQTETLAIGVVNADGEKCDRCWNYSTQVGTSAQHPLLCERCIPALDGQF
jgi:isoleucyl-tRNA synthetase